MQFGNYYHLSSCIVPFWLGSFRLQYSQKEAIVRREHRESLRENRVGAGERLGSVVSIVFDTSFGNTGSLYALRLVNFNGLRQTLCQALGLAGAESNKHGERHVKPSLHRLSPSFPQFFARLLFCCSPGCSSALTESLPQVTFLLRASERGPATPIKLILPSCYDPL